MLFRVRRAGRDRVELLLWVQEESFWTPRFICLSFHLVCNCQNKEIAKNTPRDDELNPNQHTSREHHTI